MENALRGETLVKEEWDARTAPVSRQVEEAAEEYRSFFLKWLGIEAQDVDATLSPDALPKQWGVDLESLYGGGGRFDLRPVGSLPGSDPSTPWNEQTIWAFTNIVPFQVRIDCGGSGSTPDVFCLSDEVMKIWDRLLVVRANLHSLNTQAEVALAKAHNAVDLARETVESNAEQLEVLLLPADPLLLRSKEKGLALAETSLAEVEALLAGLRERRELGLALDLPAAAPGTGEGIDTTMLDDVSESLRRELPVAQRT